MSYDLFFKARSDGLDEAAFFKYFSERPLYKCEEGQAWYGNEDTGVYFLFELTDEPPAEGDRGELYPVALNINFFRPSYFIHEAEPEVTAFVKHFDLVVYDPQMEGMGEGEYSSEKLISGWNRGNEFGYQAILREPKDNPDIFHLPTDTLERVWRWNYRRSALQMETGESKFVPRIMFLKFSDTVVTSAVWPDGIPAVIPRVDYLCVPRQELAPKKLFRRQEDTTFVSWADAEQILLEHGSRNDDGSISCGYADPPPRIAKFVKSLPKDDRSVSGVAPDVVLNREMFERYVTQ